MNTAIEVAHVEEAGRGVGGGDSENSGRCGVPGWKIGQILDGLREIEGITMQVGRYAVTIQTEGSGCILGNSKELGASMLLIERQIQDIREQMEQVSRSFQTSMDQNTEALESMNQALKKLKIRG